MQSAKTSIVILTFNQLVYTKMCIESIRQFTDKNAYELIIVDNNSTDGTVAWLKEQPDIRTILNNENLGFPKGCNQGISIATGDSILLLNNDVIVTYHWLTNLRQCLYSSNEIGAVSAVTNSCSNNQTIPISYQSIPEMLVFAAKYNINKAKEWEERLKLIGFCLLIKKSVVDKIGLLDEIFTPGNFEDDDYSVRIRLAGFKLLLCKNAFIHHFGSISFKENSEKHKQLLTENCEKFQKKWGFTPEYLTAIRQDIVALIDTPSAKPCILEIGCACGATLLQIKTQYNYAELYGIEANAHAAQNAKLFANILIGNIEALPLDYPADFFDYIILGNVLEHLKDPEEVLTQLYTYLAPSGKILVSIPNAVHFNIIKTLLYGYLPYETTDISLKRPPRFFTLHGISKMFQAAGFKDLEYNSICMDCSPENSDFVDALVSLTNDNMKTQYLTYQYLITAKKGGCHNENL